MHLLPEYGSTYRQIEADGFSIDVKLPMLLASDDGASLTKSVGVGLIGLADAFRAIAPDIVVVLGDRFEILSVAITALLEGIPLAHLHGGERTEGAIDESIRHAVTKMSHLHFVAAEEYRDRVIQLGEDSSRVFHVGAPGLDNVVGATLPTLEALAGRVGRKLERPLFLVTFHPATLERGVSSEEAIARVFRALDIFPDGTVVMTKSNADEGGRAYGVAMDAYAAKRSDRVVVHASLGVETYLGLAKAADVVIGNSSSGLIEVPVLGTPTVNVGARQAGRLRAPSVIDCTNETDDIVAAIKRAQTPAFRELARRGVSPYRAPGGGQASEKIAETLITVPLVGILTKKFHDMDRGR